MEKAVFLFLLLVVSFVLSGLLSWGILGVIGTFLIVGSLLLIGDFWLTRNQNLIDTICQNWAKNRNPLLSYLITKKQWIASQPFSVRVLTALKLGKVNIVTGAGAKVIDPLLKALNDSDSVIKENAKKSVVSLTDFRSIDYLCQKWEQSKDKQLEKIIIQARYIAIRPLKVKILTALKTERLDEITSESWDGVAILLESLDDTDEQIASQAQVSLNHLRNQEGINWLCHQWSQDRDNFLQALIIQNQYLPTAPLKAKILTALKTERLDEITSESWDGVAIILESLDDTDEQIVNQAQASLNHLRNQEGINCLCHQWAQDRDDFLQALIIQNQYLATRPLKVKILTALKTERLEKIPSGREEIAILSEYSNDPDFQVANIARKVGDNLKVQDNKVLYYFLSEQWDKYQRIDFDQNILNKIFHLDLGRIRHKITDKVKKSGKSEWLSIIMGAEQEQNLESMSEYDWQVALEVLSKNHNYEQIWRLAKKAPPLWSKRLLAELNNLDFLSNQEEQISIKELQSLATNCIEPKSELCSLLCQVQVLCQVQYYHTEKINSLVMNSEGTILASASSDKTVKLWSLPEGQLLSTLEGHNGSVTSVAMNSEGSLLASASSDKTVKLWSLPEGQLLSTIKGHTESVNSVAMNSEGTLLASGGGDKTVKLWSLPKGQFICTLEGHTGSVYGHYSKASYSIFVLSKIITIKFILTMILIQIGLGIIVMNRRLLMTDG